MKRIPQLLVALLVLALFGLWYLVSGDPKPEGAASDEDDEAHAVQVERVEPKMHREVAPTVVPSTPSPEAAKANSKPAVSDGMTGVVKELGGVAVPDVLIELVDKAGLTVASTVSGENGRFAVAEPMAAGLSIVTRLQSGEGPRIRHPRLRGRPGAKLTNVTLWIPPSATIEGSVVDAAGRAVAGATVATDRPPLLLGMPHWHVLPGPKVEMGMFVKTDAAGRFVLRSVKRGSHRLRASHGDVEGSGLATSGDRGVVLQLGAHLGGSVVLEGHVRDGRTGAPIAAAQVSVQLVRKIPGGSSATGVARVMTNERGYYQAKGLVAGSYRLHGVSSGYASSGTRSGKFDEGSHTIDFDLDPARELTVHVVEPDGSSAARVDVRVLDGKRKILRRALRVDKSGKVKMRALPAVPVTLLATRGDLQPAGRIDIDLTERKAQQVTIVMPTAPSRFARTHYFKLLGPDGKPARVEGAVIAESFVGGKLLSRVEGHWRGDEFFFGHEQRNGFDDPTIAIGAPKGACRVEITVPGYWKQTLTLEPGAKSPTRVRLRH